MARVIYIFKRSIKEQRARCLTKSYGVLREIRVNFTRKHDNSTVMRLSYDLIIRDGNVQLNPAVCQETIN